MKKLRNAILPILFVSALITVWGALSMGCDEDVCSDWDLDQCWESYDDCVSDLNVTVSDSGVDLEENCAIEYCQCLDNEGCDWSAIPQCEE